MEYLSALEKEKSLFICNNMDEPREHDAKWNKSGTKDKNYVISWRIFKTQTHENVEWNGDFHRLVIYPLHKYKL